MISLSLSPKNRVQQAWSAVGAAPEEKNPSQRWSWAGRGGAEDRLLTQGEKQVVVSPVPPLPESILVSLQAATCGAQPQAASAF